MSPVSPDYIIFRVKLNGHVERVEGYYGGGHRQGVQSYIESTYLYDSVEGEHYFVLDPVACKVIVQFQVKTVKRLVIA